MHPLSSIALLISFAFLPLLWNREDHRMPSSLSILPLVMIYCSQHPMWYPWLYHFHGWLQEEFGCLASGEICKVIGSWPVATTTHASTASSALPRMD